MTNGEDQLKLQASLLEDWADLYSRAAFLDRLTFDDWQSAEALIKAAEVADIDARDRLGKLLECSNKALIPLADPLEIDFGAHRWLSSSREEVYSDWLAWILGQIGDARGMLKLFGCHDEDIIQACGLDAPKIERELPILGRKRRPDLVIRFGKSALVVVEIKTKWFDEEGVRKQLTDYADWAECQGQIVRCFLVAVELGDFDCPVAFEPLTWREVSLRLRHQAREWVKPPQGQNYVVPAAMILAFCGAVEQRLLGFSKRAKRFGVLSSVEYLEDWIG